MHASRTVTRQGHLDTRICSRRCVDSSSGRRLRHHARRALFDLPVPVILGEMRSCSATAAHQGQPDHQGAFLKNLARARALRLCQRARADRFRNRRAARRGGGRGRRGAGRLRAAPVADGERGERRRPAGFAR